MSFKRKRWSFSSRDEKNKSLGNKSGKVTCILLLLRSVQQHPLSTPRSPQGKFLYLLSHFSCVSNALKFDKDVVLSLCFFLFFFFFFFLFLFSFFCWILEVWAKRLDLRFQWVLCFFFVFSSLLLLSSGFVGPSPTLLSGGMSYRFRPVLFSLFSVRLLMNLGLLDGLCIWTC